MGLFGSISKALRGAADRLALLDPPGPLPSSPSGGTQARRIPITDRWHRVSHPGHGLTPRRLVEIYAMAERGFPAEQCALFDDMTERDLHMRSQHEQRIDEVAGKDWIVQAGGDSEADRFAAAELDARLRKVPNFGELLEHQLTANGYGYAGSEIDWDKVDGVFAPVWFSNVPHRRFRFDEYERPRILTDSNWLTGEDLPHGRYMFSRRRGTTTVRAGYLRSACLYSYFKTLSLRDWMVFAERFGLPFVYGRYDEGAPDDERDALLAAVKMLGKDGSAIFSRASEIAIEHAQGGNSEGVHASIITMMDGQISKLITGSSIIADGGEGGSYALSRVQQSRTFSITVADAKRLADRFEQDIGVPFVTWNGIAARAPRLKMHIVRDVDPQTRANVITTLAAGLKLRVDEEQIRQEFQLKAPVNGEGLGAPEAPAPGAAPKPSGGDGADDSAE